MATKLKNFQVTVNLNITVGFDIRAESLHQAIELAQNMGISEIVDFKLNDWDHIDSEEPVIIGVYTI